MTGSDAGFMRKPLSMPGLLGNFSYAKSTG